MYFLFTLIKICSILQITVTLKITRDRKPIAPSYTTKVPRGTLLVDILNKAAGDDTKGPFNKYESIYYGGTYKGVLLGYYLTAMDGIKQDPATKSFWMIIDEKSGDYTPCGVSSYVPGDCLRLSLTSVDSNLTNLAPHTEAADIARKFFRLARYMLRSRPQTRPPPPNYILYQNHGNQSPHSKQQQERKW